MRLLACRFFALIAFTILAGQALADDWSVTRLRGQVVQLVDDAWQPLERGNVVSDARSVATQANGHVTLTRGNETIELGPNTQIQIYDEGGRKPFTTVVQTAGTVAIEADVRNVQHFAVKTQYLAAVVKGTRFTVTTTRSGSTVEVERGHVEVDSELDHSTTLLAVGQNAKVQKGRAMAVSGKGKLPVVLKKGEKSSNAVADKVAAATAAVELAVANLEQAKATGDRVAIEAAKDALQEAADDAAYVAKDAAKGDDKAAAKAAADAAKAAEKAAKDAEKAADKAAKDQAKAESDAAKAADEARKAAEKAAKDADKAAKNDDRNSDDSASGKGKPDDEGDSSNNDQSEKSGHDDNSGKGESDDKPSKKPK